MRDIESRISYKEYLVRRRQAAQALRDAEPKPPHLHERIKTWFDGLLDYDKKRAWKMAELKVIFGESPQKIGAALWELGWSRRRSWKDDRPTSRHWYKE